MTPSEISHASLSNPIKHRQEHCPCPCSCPWLMHHDLSIHFFPSHEETLSSCYPRNRNQIPDLLYPILLLREKMSLFKIKIDWMLLIFLSRIFQWIFCIISKLMKLIIYSITINNWMRSYKVILYLKKSLRLVEEHSPKQVTALWGKTSWVWNPFLCLQLAY